LFSLLLDLLKLISTISLPSSGAALLPYFPCLILHSSHVYSIPLETLEKKRRATYKALRLEREAQKKAAKEDKSYSGGSGLANPNKRRKKDPKANKKRKQGSLLLAHIHAQTSRADRYLP
jgi:hypothetical protein